MEEFEAVSKIADYRLLGINVIGFLCTLFLMILCKANKMLDASKKKYFFMAGLELMFMIFLEGFDYLFYCLFRYGFITNATAIMYARFAIAFVEYSLMPIVPATVIKVIGTIRKNIVWLFVIPCIGLCVGNIFGKFMYTINPVTCEFEYQTFSFLPALITFIGVLILIVATLKRYATFQKAERGIMIMMLVFGCAVAILQFFFLSGTFLVWNMFAIFILVYYLLVHIQLYSLDSLTGLYNRQTYENDMNEYNERYDCTLIMIDLNNLKKINDIRGHAEGDRAINRISRFLLMTFGKIGRCYRIGGDEFAVICRCPEVKVNDAHNALMKKISEQEYTIAYGAVRYDHRGEDSIVTRFKEADHIMYENKAMIKRSLSLKNEVEIR